MKLTMTMKPIGEGKYFSGAFVSLFRELLWVTPARIPFYIVSHRSLKLWPKQFEGGKETATDLKFNSLPLKNIPSPKERIVFQPSFCRGHVKLRGCESLIISFLFDFSTIVFKVNIYVLNKDKKWYTFVSRGVRAPDVNKMKLFSS